jgi:hypothetical protein
VTAEEIRRRIAGAPKAPGRLPEWRRRALEAIHARTNRSAWVRVYREGCEPW